MVDSWHQFGIQPYDHIICSTPLFHLWLGAAQYLFRQPIYLMLVSLSSFFRASHLSSQSHRFRIRPV
ncbi:hypothetical protein BGX38DRAFT_1213462 [Terfezia claveryi]|nr:hypothetical protein BGX38DRAFT_1213462 [Terfezia claveryi]